jgi:hypothetical protein
MGSSEGSHYSLSITAVATADRSATVTEFADKKMSTASSD